ncbi:hypothetical protein GCM10009792_20250 [Microcella alkalica]
MGTTVVFDPRNAALSGDAVAAVIGERYGLRIADVDLLPGELDVNCRATDIDGTSWFVRLSPEPLDVDSVEWQNRVLRQLELRPLSVATPRLIPQRNGEYCSSFPGRGDRTFLIRLTSWVDGRNASELGETTRSYREQVGALAADIVTSLSPLNSDAHGQRDHHWAAVASGASIRSTMHAASWDRRQYLEHALDWFDAVADQITELPLSVVHQDLHDFNLLAKVDDHGQPYVSGVVDFNDAVLTARVAELAVAASYATLRQPDAFPAFCDVVRGYLRHETLTAGELDLLYPLGVARLAVNASTWTQRSTGENSAYAHARMAATWPALQSLLETSPDAAAATLRSFAEESQESAPSGLSSAPPMPPTNQK